MYAAEKQACTSVAAPGWKIGIADSGCTRRAWGDLEMRRIGLSGFWILFAISLIDIVIWFLPLTSVAIICCLLFYPSGIRYAGRWLSRLHEDMSNAEVSR